MDIHYSSPILHISQSSTFFSVSVFVLSDRSHMPPTIVLITGANRGLGKGFLERHLATPNYTVIAAHRNPEHFTSKDLGNLPKALGSSLIIVKVDSASRSDALGAVDELRGRGIEHLGIVIANAAILDAFPRVVDVSIDGLERYMNINVYGIPSAIVSGYYITIKKGY